MTIDPMASAAYTIEAAGSAFKFAKKTMTSFIYSKDGNDPTFETGVPYIEITQYPAEENLSMEEFVKTHAESSLYVDLPEGETKHSSTLTINGMQAYQSEIHGVGEQKGQIHYHCGLTNGKTMIVFTGKAPVDAAAHLKEFKRLVNSIRLR
jgi:hypothetical protein